MQPDELGFHLEESYVGGSIGQFYSPARQRNERS